MSEYTKNTRRMRPIEHAIYQARRGAHLMRTGRYPATGPLDLDWADRRDDDADILTRIYLPDEVRHD
jgi:hypothetical protein